MQDSEMQAIEIINPGPDAHLNLTKRPVPTPGANEVLIKTHAAGINRPDIVQKQGRYNPPPGITDLPGLEIAGEILEIGPGSDPCSFNIGDEICALVAGGGYAEYCIAPVGQCLPVPKGYSMVQAAALPETFFTVWRNLFDVGGFQKGETALVHGGSSGIGTTAIQMTNAFGGRVFVTAGSDEKCRFCEDLGAAKAINYKTQDFVQEIENMTDQKGVDIVIDMVGGDYVARNIKTLAENGRHISIAIQKGAEGTVNIFQVMRKRLTLTGSVLRPRPIAEKAQIAENLHKHIWPLLESGDIQPIIFESFPLAQATQAHEIMEKSQHMGKIILDITP